MAVNLLLAPVVRIAITKLVDTATEQVSLAWGWKKQLKKFIHQMEMLQGVLQDADEKHAAGHPGLKAWLERLRDVAEEADDLFQKAAYENTRHQVAAAYKEVSYYLAPSDSNPTVFRQKMANKVKRLTEKLAEINKSANDLGLQYSLANITSVPEPRVRQTHSLPSSYVIGRDKDVKAVVSMLTDDSSSGQKQLPVISIVGMGGLGKTTLAQKVRVSDEICSHFSKIMWVCVSENFVVQSILGEMLESLGQTSREIKNRDTLVQEIKKRLAGGTYLLILDDVWNEDGEKWDDLRDCLLAAIDSKLGSRVVVTTRSEKVAGIMGTHPDHLHRLKGLEDDQCLDIIMKMAFGDYSSVPSGLMEIGRAIAKKCGGVPLVASVIGGTLCNNFDRNEWLSIQNNIDARGSLGEECDRRIVNILKLSFHRLPKPALKQCFVFCSAFPKDSVMGKELLVQMWTAEGYLSPSGEGVSMEDVGREYFNDLIAHSLLQEEKRDSFGNVSDCKMHDLVHDLASSIAEGETVFFGVGSQNKVSEQVRHLNLTDGCVPSNYEDVAENLRTLYLMRSCSSNLLTDSRRLRVFSLCDINTEQLPLVNDLCNNFDRNVWESVRSKIDATGSLGAERDRRIMDVLKLSFHRLPNPAMKQCFAYSAIFPKDYIMEKETLIQLWMAHGFLQPSKGCTMEDVGEEYFNGLLAYSLFQEEGRDSLGNVNSCKMHDLAHDLAQSITECETVISDAGSQVPDLVRHLNIIDDVPINLKDVTEKLRTLFLKRQCSSNFLTNLRRLRVFSLCDEDTEELPLCLSKLKRLSFLDISGTRIKRLPKFISKLYNLQTFRYMNCRNLESSPAGIENLLNLRHLYFDREEVMPANIGRLVNLQTLKVFWVGHKKGFRIEELGSLSQLRGELEIKNLERVRDRSEAERAKLQEKAVEVLSLKFDSRREGSNHDEDVLEGLRPPSTLKMLSIEGYRGSNLPSWVTEMKNLVELKIKKCTMLIGIPRLDGFHCLQRLLIRDCNELSMIGDGEIVPNTSRLEELDIKYCPELATVSLERFSQLRKLRIDWCSKLCSIKGSISTSTSYCIALESLTVTWCLNLGCFPDLDGLTSLKTIYIQGCDQLEFLPSGLSSCTALESLTAESCKNLKCIPSLDGFTSLRTVEIKGCDQLELLPDNLSSCTALESLDIWNCKNLRFQGLDGLTSLKSLSIGYCDQLVCLPSGLSSCTALEKLDIRDCENLVFAPKDLEALRSLVHLVIGGCQKLKGNPASPDESECKSLTSLVTLKKLEMRSYSAGLEAFLSSIHYLPSIEELDLVAIQGAFPPLPQHVRCYASLKVLTIKGCQVESLPPSQPSPHGLGELSSLTTLVMFNCDLISIPEGLKELPSLVELDISCCRKLRSFPAAAESNFSCLTSLRRLTIGGFSKDLEEFPDLSSFPPIPNLEYLHLIGWNKVTQLPHQIIQHLGGGGGGASSSSSLKELEIEDFHGLEAMPEWLGNLSSLQSLVIKYCNNLKNLPSAEAIQRLTKLHRLQIWGCSVLEERCVKDKGPEWSKISHIPNIKISGIQIKSDDRAS